MNMSKHIVMLLFASSLYAQTTVYVSPEGSDSYAGTISLPFLTIAKGVASIPGGGIVYLRGGTYSYTTSSRLILDSVGTSGSRFRLWAYPGETPIIDFTGQNNFSDMQKGGIELGGSFWHLKGITEQNRPEGGSCPGLMVEGSDNIIENCTFRKNGTNGVYVDGRSQNAARNLLLNCDAYDNYGPLAGGGDTDGFGISQTLGTGNVARGCRAWHNSDDGFDLWRASSPVVLDSCWSFGNGYDAGNGNGYKLGGYNGVDSAGASHIVRNCVAANNKTHGFTYNINPYGMTLYNCIAYHNGGNGFLFNGIPVYGTNVFANNIEYGNAWYNAIGAPKTESTNSWQGFTVTNGDFLSVDSTGEAGRARKSGGSLPSSNFLRLVSGSDLVNTGTNVGISYLGSGPDLGAFESIPTIAPSHKQMWIKRLTGTVIVAVDTTRWISVKAYGAKADGTTDDTQDINDAITAASSGDTVYFSSGTYIVSSSGHAPYVCMINLKEGVSLYGVGATVKVKNSNGNYYAVMMGSVGNFSISGLTIDQNIANNDVIEDSIHSDSMMGAIVSWTGDNIVIENNTIKNVVSINTVCVGGTNEIIRNNIFTGIGDNAAHTNIDHSTIYNFSASGSLTVSGNYFEGATTTAPSTYAAIETHSSNTLVYGNTIKNYKAAMNIACGEGGAMHNIIVRKNTIQTYCQGIWLWADALSGNTSGVGLDTVTVDSNSVTITQSLWTGSNKNIVGIGYYSGSLLELRNITIANNTITFDKETAAPVYTATAIDAGISFQNPLANPWHRNISIRNNTITNCPGPGIAIADKVSNLDIRSNTLVDCIGTMSPDIDASLKAPIRIWVDSIAASIPVVVAHNTITDSYDSTRAAYAFIYLNNATSTAGFKSDTNLVTFSGSKFNAYSCGYQMQNSPVSPLLILYDEHAGVFTEPFWDVEAGCHLRNKGVWYHTTAKGITWIAD